MASERQSEDTVGVGGGGDRPNNAVGTGGRSALISDLVAQLKRGEITKADLFTKLQQLQGVPSGAASSAGIAHAAPTKVSSHGVQPPRRVSKASGVGVSPASLSTAAAEEADTVDSTGFAEESDIHLSGTEGNGNGDGEGTAGAAGFFTAYDRQAIIKRIAEERRRRAQAVRQSWPNELQFNRRPSYDDLVGAEWPNSTDQPIGAVGHWRSDGGDYPTDRPSPTSFRTPSSANSTNVINRRVAWGKGSEPSPQDTIDSSGDGGGDPISTDEFPFPTRRVTRRGVRRRDDDGRGAGSNNNNRSFERSDQRFTSNDHRPVLNAQRPRPTHQLLAPSAQRRVARRTKAGRRGSGKLTIARQGKTITDTPNARVDDTNSTNAQSSNLGRDPVDDRLTADDVAGESMPKPTQEVQEGTNSERSSPLVGNCSPSSNKDTGDEARGRDLIGGEEARFSHSYGELTPEEYPGGVESSGTVMPYGRAESFVWNQGPHARVKEFVDSEEERQYRARQRGAASKGAVRGERRVPTERIVDEDAYHFRSFSEERARRGEELVRRELMSECTFRPKIKGLPPSYGATQHEDAPFLQRVTQWQKEKEKEAAARKADGTEKELEDCTFAPHVNRVSRRAALSRREALGERHLAVDERLFDESVRRDMDRSHLEAEQAAKAEEKLRQECTFKPELTTETAAAQFFQRQKQQKQRYDNSDNHYDDSQDIVITEPWGTYTIPRGRSRYRQAAAAVAATAGPSAVVGGIWDGVRRPHRGEKSRDWELEGCTFTPTVIGARKGMGQAQQYLQYDVVERLTGAAFRDPEDEVDNDHDDERGQLWSGSVDILRRTNSSGQGSGSGGGSVSGDKAGSEESTKAQRQRKAEEMASFHAFLSRQNRMETDKIKHMQAIQAMKEPSFKPKICPESVKIHNESSKGDFLQRVARDAARKEHEAVRRKAAGQHDPDCTFRPQITARSSTLPVRSVVELSRGDQLKRETTQRLTKLRAEQELLVDTTFRPRITEAASRMAISRLRVVSDPNSYNAMVEMLRQRKEESVIKGAIEKERKEVEGCTFKPNTTACPTYITRIAQSISAAKAGNGVAKKKVMVKPDWR